MTISLTPLGAGQDVGRSCILVSIGEKNVIFDCGMHMGYEDERRFPDFSLIANNKKDFNLMIDCVLVSHFHLDHCGSLPYFTEMCGYDGPVYMTHPTKALCPLLLEDYRSITVDKTKSESQANFFSSQDIKNCMKKVTAVNIHECIHVGGDPEFLVKAYYAGHVLGACMFFVKYKDESVVYTGDYNMTPDRHLGAAWIDKVRPDILITETTYATTIRDFKKARERDFLSKVDSCVRAGGKVLIPVFALGRAQELCILIESYWERMGLDIPIYFSAGITQRANNYYRLFINWTNQKLKRTFSERNMFDFKKIKPLDMSMIDNPVGMVIFASPGMLHSGTSLEIFKRWASDPKNMVILPGYCVPGTVGARVLAGESSIELDKNTTIDVKLQIKHLSFSAHADARGIMQMIRMSEPRAVVLVHGEYGKMNILKDNIVDEFKIPCYTPENGETIYVSKDPVLQVEISSEIIKKYVYEGNNGERQLQNAYYFDGILTLKENRPPRILTREECFKEVGRMPSWIFFTYHSKVKNSFNSLEEGLAILSDLIRSKIENPIVTHQNMIQLSTIEISLSTNYDCIFFKWNIEVRSR
jgi:integrator complex subunit 11